MTTSNCMTCIYGGSWTGEQSTEPGYCYMFKEEPYGVCGQWKHSIHEESAEFSLKQWNSLAPIAQPDCRTCAQYQEAEGICEYPLFHGFKQCTNGDKYEAAPAVVLWRTE